MVPGRKSPPVPMPGAVTLFLGQREVRQCELDVCDDVIAQAVICKDAARKDITVAMPAATGSLL